MTKNSNTSDKAQGAIGRVGKNLRESIDLSDIGILIWAITLLVVELTL